MFRLPEKKREMIYLDFLRSTHRKKSADITDDSEPQQATISGVPCGSYNGKWRELPMRNDGLLPYVYTSWVFGRVFSGGMGLRMDRGSARKASSSPSWRVAALL